MGEEIARNGLTPPKGRGITGRCVASPPRFSLKRFLSEQSGKRGRLDLTFEV